MQNGKNYCKIRFIKAIPILSVWVLLLAVSGCDRLSVKDTLEGEEYILMNQFHEEISFPADVQGKVVLVGYVYTHCPDICPIITFNMRDIQQELAGRNDFMLISISFDPQRDTPEVLSEYASNYRLDQNNWQLLTGEPQNVESVLKRLKIGTLKSPTRFTESGTPVYFIDHTDRVTLIDEKGQIRKNYTGSELNKNEVVNDILVLLNQS